MYVCMYVYIGCLGVIDAELKSTIFYIHIYIYKGKILQVEIGYCIII